MPEISTKTATGISRFPTKVSSAGLELGHWNSASGRQSRRPPGSEEEWGATATQLFQLSESGFRHKLFQLSESGFRHKLFQLSESTAAQLFQLSESEFRHKLFQLSEFRHKLFSSPSLKSLDATVPALPSLSLDTNCCSS